MGMVGVIFLVLILVTLQFAFSIWYERFILFLLLISLISFISLSTLGTHSHINLFFSKNKYI